MSRQHHYVKILPEYYMAVESGIKTFEIRFNDRNYKVGDILHLQEFCGGEYTGRVIEKEICYIIDSPEYCKEGFVVLGLKGCEVSIYNNFIPATEIKDYPPYLDRPKGFNFQKEKGGE